MLGDDALPEGGPGRGEHGAFVLNEVRLTAGPVDGAPPSGRFVRIELPGAKRMLSLAEVQVFAGDANLAPGGKARQSSTAFDGRPELAIDKNTDGDYQKKSVTHTSEESDPWWEVDLGRTAAVERVAIWNRTDGGLEARLVPMRLLVLDESRQPLRQRTLVEPPKPSVEVKLAEPTEVAWAEATADAEQHDFPVAKAIDGSDKPESGWSSGLGGGKPRVAVFRTRQPIAAATPGPMALRLALVQTKAGQTIGRFRVSVTMAASPPKAIPADVREALAVAPESRSEAAHRALAAYAWSQSPDSEALRGQIVALESQVKEIEKEIPSTPILRELPESNRRVTHTMVKGNFRATGDEVTPAVPSAFHAWPEGTPRDRLGLARWLVARDNPLTARVTVNRLWAQLFSVGIVATEEDFGTQGLPPTHPQLLDWLAVDFMDGGWNMKAILREIVCSATYRQSSTPAADALAKDPNNQLLAHGPRQRLEAEMVRDQALAISGLLARKLGGQSVYPPQPPGLWRAAFNGQRTWATSSGEDRYRRGLYTYWRRTVPYPSMAAFDAPSREICTLRRVSTNTPLQAFVTLNDPVYVEAAQALARRVMAEGGVSVEERAGYALRLALARPAAEPQVARLAELYHSELEHYRGDATAAEAMATDPLGPLPPGTDAAEAAAWTVVANVVLNLDGVLTKR